MEIKVYYPAVLHPIGFEYDSSKKQYALFTTEKDGFRLICGPTSDLGDLVRKLNILVYSLEYSSPFNELKLDGISYTVTAFHSGDLKDFNRLRRIL